MQKPNNTHAVSFNNLNNLAFHFFATSIFDSNNNSIVIHCTSQFSFRNKYIIERYIRWYQKSIALRCALNFSFDLLNLGIRFFVFSANYIIGQINVILSIRWIRRFNRVVYLCNSFFFFRFCSFAFGTFKTYLVFTNKPI